MYAIMIIPNSIHFLYVKPGPQKITEVQVSENRSSVPTVETRGCWKPRLTLNHGRNERFLELVSHYWKKAHPAPSYTHRVEGFTACVKATVAARSFAMESGSRL